VTSFDAFPLRPDTRTALTAMAVHSPTPIQSAALPEMLAGRDVIGQARTGSGKTLAFALPIVERVDERVRAVQALVLVPTRELASQVAGVVQGLCSGRDLRVQLLVGGVAVGPQKQALRQGAQVVVGTPGRVLDHLNQGSLRLDRLRLLVLDEADEMLDRGFAPDVERIIAATPAARQTALFSATVPDWVGAMAARHLRAPISVRVDGHAQPVEHVDHAVYDVPLGGKLAALRALLDARDSGTTLVFGRTKHGVKKLAKQLGALGYPVVALQGNLSQNARDRAMAEFRSGQAPILIATNVAARGLDVDHITQVINYELPETAELLTHRVGRTGRMGRSGEAITLLTPDDEAAWKKLLRGLRRHPTRRPWRGSHTATVAGATAHNTPGRRMSPLPSPAKLGEANAARPTPVTPSPTSGIGRGGRGVRATVRPAHAAWPGDSGYRPGNATPAASAAPALPRHRRRRPRRRAARTGAAAPV
jgi:ATP-dependent RNA helicase DeaD